MADPDDLDAVAIIEGLTNPRLRNEVGELAFVPQSRRVAGPGTTPIMAAFTHLNPEGTRFGDGTYGVLYAAHDERTAVRETMYHSAQFLTDTREPPLRIEMRCYRTGVRGSLHDLRQGYEAEHDPVSYAASRALAAELRGAGSDGIVYRSVRHAGGECVAAFYPDLVMPHVQARHYQYVWDGVRITDVLEMRSMPV